MAFTGVCRVDRDPAVAAGLAERLDGCVDLEPPVPTSTGRVCRVPDPAEGSRPRSAGISATACPTET
jgi:hypothetical protein